jgi:hypothetical protein
MNIFKKRNKVVFFKKYALYLQPQLREIVRKTCWGTVARPAMMATYDRKTKQE